MKPLITLLSSSGFIRRFSVVAGLLAAISLIWFAGPSVGLRSIEIRLLLIIALIAALLIFYGYRWWRDKKRGAALEKDLQQSAGSNPQSAELKNKMLQAIAALKTSRLGMGYRGNTALYALPWYLIMGPSAAGKTTLLRNSGLHFPLASQEDVRITGFGGTRNCDWWFADEAVILDTAGRYTTEVNDHDEWITFLNILKKHRRQLPINGVIIAISLADLLIADKSAVDQHANIIRERIEELTQQLGYLLPVNVVLTKCDLLKGFTEFFNYYSLEEREQVWGLSLTHIVDPTIPSKQQVEQRLQAIKEKFSYLHAKLAQLRVQQLTVEQNPDIKPLIYDFPAQFKVASEQLYQFFAELLHDNPYQNEINLAGIFFTSGCQEGIGVERQVGLQAKTGFSLSPVAARSKGNMSFFIRRLLKEVIFENRFAAVRNRRQKLIHSWIKTAAISAAGLVTLMSVIFWGAAYSINYNLLDSGVDSVKQLKIAFTSSDTTRQDILSAQLGVYNAYKELSEHSDNIPFYKRLGLYEGNKQLPYLSAILLTSLQRTMLESLPDMMSGRLEYYVRQWNYFNADKKLHHYSDYYQTLRAYLLLSLHTNEDTAADAQYLGKIWALQLNGQSPSSDLSDTTLIDTEQLGKLAGFYLQSTNTGLDKNNLRKVWVPNSTLIAGARQHLYRPVQASNVYLQLVKQLQAKLPTLTISQLIAGTGGDMFSNPDVIPGMYTADGWNNAVYDAIHNAAIEASRGDWVLIAPLSFSDMHATKPSAPEGPINKTAQKEIEKSLRSEYFNNYVSVWYNWLAKIQIINFVSMQEASHSLEVLANSKGPMVKLMQGIGKNISVSDTPDSSRLAPEIQQIFAPVRDFVGAGSRVSFTAGLSDYFDALTKLQSKLHSVAIAGNPAREARQLATVILQPNSADNQFSKTRSKINEMLNNVNNPAAKSALSSLFMGPLIASWRSILNEASRDVQAQWESQILPGYQAVILNKFPFNTTSDQDADLNSVKQFFDLNVGTFWQYVNSSLKPFVQQQGNDWHTASWLGIGMNFSPNFINKLNQAQQISSLLFGNNVAPGQFSYSLYPVPQASVSDLQFMVNGKLYRYQNGPQEWQSAHWSINDTQQGSQLLIQKGSNEAEAQLDGNGPWGLFRILDKASVSKNNNAYLLTWQMSGSDGSPMTAKLKFRTENAADAIQAFVTSSFILPNNVIQTSG